VRRPTLLIISQVYVPDPASVGQHVADAAAEMARRGYRVVVYASARGYDDPSQRYPSRELRDGVDVRRLPLSSFGKSSIAVRLIAQWIFLVQAIVRGLLTRGLVGVVVSTSPPFAGVAGVVIGRIRRCKVVYWVMDLNPDQMIALGMITERSLRARVFRAFNRAILRRADDVVVLDRFMAERVRGAADVGAKMSVMPPWPHEEVLGSVDHAVNPFRSRHGLQGKFVVMYSGNHSPANPITTVLDAAERLTADERLVFLFIGGGVGKKEVEERIARGASNVRSLPYQPLAELKYSLSAADLHVVSMGDGVVGIVHPCKVYGAMAVSRPILLLGPDPCHVSDLIEQHRIGRNVRHGDVGGCERAIRELAGAPAEELAVMGRRAADVIATTLSKNRLCGRFCDVIQRGLPAS
jgi:glycosyltransferase involved in cell wall biosynthesis